MRTIFHLASLQENLCSNGRKRISGFFTLKRGMQSNVAYNSEQ